MRAPENNSPKKNYQWPRYVLALVIVGILAAIIWVAVAAKKVSQLRDFNAPLPASAPAR